MSYRKKAPVKYSAYALLLLAIFVLQSARGTRITLLGGTVNAIPFFIAAVALMDGPYPAGALGFFAGLLVSIHSSVLEGLSALYFGLFGVAFGWFGSLQLRRVLPSAFLGGTVCLVGGWLFKFIFYYALVYGVPAAEGLKWLLGELLLSAPVGAALFFAVRALTRHFAEGEE